MEDGRRLQPASGQVLFTNDVIWTETREVNWASRWDIYLYMDNAVSILFTGCLWPTV
jgi:hypothetical protein